MKKMKSTERNRQKSAWRANSSLSAMTAKCAEIGSSYIVIIVFENGIQWAMNAMTAKRVEIGIAYIVTIVFEKGVQWVISR